ncbi:MAG: hypothetical protein D3906_06700 [Candidatus Electrothrix sp. AUS1_2]|nr:hypothetical protein [Candidatus Electrothrix sp. AUS1_2]
MNHHPIFKTQQSLFDAELQIQIGEFTKAKEIIQKLDDENLGNEEVNDLAFLYSKMGVFDKASDIREKLMASHSKIFGDDNREVMREFKENLKQQTYETPVHDENMEPEQAKENVWRSERDLEL